MKRALEETLPNEIWNIILSEWELGDREVHVLRFTCKTFHKTTHANAIAAGWTWDILAFRLTLFDNNVSLTKWAINTFGIDIYESMSSGKYYFSKSSYICVVAARNGHLDMLKLAEDDLKLPILSKELWWYAFRGRQKNVLKWLYQRDYGVLPQEYVPKLPEGISEQHLEPLLLEEGNEKLWRWFIENFDCCPEAVLQLYRQD